MVAAHAGRFPARAREGLRSDAATSPRSSSVTGRMWITRQDHSLPVH